MTDAGLCKFRPLVLSFIQSNDMRYTEVTENLQVIFWGVTTSIRSDLVHWSHKGDKLSGDYPVKITIFDFLIILILLIIEVSEVVPSKVDGDFESFKAVEYRATVCAVTVASISIGSEAGLVGSKGFPRDLGRLAQDDNHEGTHKVSCIGLFVKHITSVVEQFHVLVSLICEYPTELPDEFVRVCQVQWSKV